MPSWLNTVLFILLGYLMGSFPSALVIGKVFFGGIDIREHGSGNLGGTNALRTLGKKGGFAVYFIDFFKGAIAVFIAMQLGSEVHPLIVGIFALIGHIYPVFAGFRGGKAVASASGVIMVYAFSSWIVLCIVFFGSLLLLKTISISSVLSALTIFILTWWNPFDDTNLEGMIPRVIFTLFMLLIVVKHIPNYKRIINGTEPKIGQSRRGK